MPSRKQQVKRETTVDKIGNGRLKSTERTARGRANDAGDVSLVPSLSVRQSGSEKLPEQSEKAVMPRFVPVVSIDGKPLMPCHPARARELMQKGKAKKQFRLGIMFLKMLGPTSGTATQEIAVGIDPGSKREAFTVKSESHTYLNVLTDAVTWVKDAVEVRRNMRRGRRFRTTPCRQNKENRSRGGMPPSTKARWGLKLRVVNQHRRIYPVTAFVVEDIKAKSGKGRRWDLSFSPLEVGKAWFYDELGKLGKVYKREGHETAEMRNELGLKKTKGKMDEVFSAHNVDSWVLANYYTAGHTRPDNEEILKVDPIRFHRRQLHVLQPTTGNVRKPYGGTVSLGFSRGSLATHPKYGIVYIGGTNGEQTSLHSAETAKRLCQNAKMSDIKLLTHNKWRARFLPGLKAGVSSRERL